jgi:hypothetical protein
MRSDGTNTTPQDSESNSDCPKEAAWKTNVDLLEKYKAMAEVKLFASDF